MEEGIPSKVGRYVIDRLIGAGAMGFVFLGKDPELDRPVAVKTLKDLGLSGEALATFLERFKNEARAAARLHHASIVQVYDVGQDPEVGPYLVFEYVAGSTLKQIIRERGALPAAEVLRLARQVSEAMDAAHAAGIIHRDIKPDNLLVARDGRTKLADFGVARIPDAALTREGQFLGTPCYAAPETLKSGTYGPRTDLFSFAAVLYEAVSGTRAFPGDDAVAVAHKVIHDDPPPPSDVARETTVPRAVDDVLMRALSKDPAERSGSASELVDTLAAAYAESGVHEGASMGTSGGAAAARPAARPGEPRGSGRLAFALVLLGGLAVGIALVFAFGGGLPTPGGDSDAGTEPDGGGDTDRAGDGFVTAASGSDSGLDAASLLLSSRPPDGSAGVVADAGFLSAHEREELAKDALDEARRYIGAQQWDDAQRALDRARRLDPEERDIEALQARIPAGS